MDRQRYKPVVVVWHYCDKDSYVHKIQALDVPVLCVGGKSSRFRRLGKLMTFRRIVSQLQPEVVHSYSFHTNWAAWFATLGSTALPVGSIRNNFIFDRQCSGRILGRACARLPHVQICNSVAAKKTAEHCATIFKAGRMYVVRNGLDLNYFYPQPYHHNRTILAVGSLYPRKRWDRLIKIVSILSVRGERFQVRHVGDGPLRGELEELARRLGVEGLIGFLGPRNDIPALIADSTFLVHTAEDEGCPNVVMEAMACGRAVVAMDAGEIPYLVAEGETGFVVRRGDERGFADRILQLLSDGDLCSRMGLASRAKAEREFGLQRLVSQTLDVYMGAGWKDGSIGSGILLIGNFLSASTGSRSVCEDLAVALKTAGWSVLTTSSRPSRFARLLDFLLTVWRQRHRYGVAQVDVYSGLAFVWAELVCWALRVARKPYVLTLHGGNLPAFAQGSGKRVQRLLQSSSAVTTPSAYLFEQMRVYCQDLVLLPNALNLTKYPFKHRRHLSPNLIWLRAFHHIYNPSLAVEVVALLLKDFPTIRLTMIGPDKGDGSRESMMDLALTLGVQDRVLCPGHVTKEEIPRWLHQGDIFLNTTRVDNTPISVLEAMACGLCVVSTNVGGIPYLIENETTGLLVSSDDPDAMAGAVARILRDAELSGRLSERGRHKVEEFDWSVILPRWESLLSRSSLRS